ncbi:MAG: ACT domain-containing protein [Candidatus Micrarchaeota archaeon]|nr:ACT domain-containing protein [Candidatus Micrarchaeota archaeon]
MDMKQLTVVVADKVGVLAELSYLLGKARVNIEAISAEVQGGKSVISLVVSDEKKAEMILKSNGYHVLAGEILVVKVKDAPGALSEISKKLQRAKINIESIYLLTRGEGYSLDALMVDKPKKAKKVLAGYLVAAQ